MREPAETHPAYITSPAFPRSVLPGLFWLGGCSNSAGWPGREHLPAVHEPISLYLLTGTERTVLVDPGHAALWYTIESQLEKALDGRPLDYILPTHPEVPHAGNLSRVHRRHPEARVIGDTRDYAVFFPEIPVDQYDRLAPGDAVSLGDSDLVMIEPVWRDLTASLWAYETGRRILFPSDGLGVLHPHQAKACGLLPEEAPQTDQADPQWLALRGAFWWMPYTDVQPSCDAFRALLESYPVDTVCSAHGAPIRNAVPFLRDYLAAIESGSVGGSLATGAASHTKS